MRPRADREGCLLRIDVVAERTGPETDEVEADVRVWIVRLTSGSN
jgi:hypothetical protein